MKIALLVLATLVFSSSFASAKTKHKPAPAAPKSRFTAPIVATCDNGDVYTLQKGKVSKNGVPLVPTLSPIEHFVDSGSINADQKILSDGSGRYFIFDLMPDTTRGGDFLSVWVHVLDNSQMEPIDTKICHTDIPL